MISVYFYISHLEDIYHITDFIFNSINKNLSSRVPGLFSDLVVAVPLLDEFAE